MSTHGLHLGTRLHGPVRHTTAQADAQATETTLTRVDARTSAIALVRVGTGFMFLWAFLDKTFGLGYSTSSSQAWIHGGSPTKGFLGHVAVGPFQSMYHSLAGTAFADWMFMLGLLGIGLALIFGIGVRVAAGAGILLVAMMWFAVYPPAQHTATGALTGSANPFVDEHVMDAFALLAVAAFGTGSRLGLGAWWAKLPFVQKHRSLL